MIVGILQPGYLPWLGYFEQMALSDVFVFYDDVQYEKGSWRNRNRIKTSSGPAWLTVPVLTKKRGAQLIKDVEINPAVSWAKKHVKTLEQNYSRAPYFAACSEGLFAILNKPWKYLADLDIAVTLWFSETLGLETRTMRSSELPVSGTQTGRLIRIVKHLGGDTFYEGAAGKDYIDPAEFRAGGVTVRFQDYKHPAYSQGPGDFLPYMSVADLLFHHGPDSLNILLGNGSLP